MASLLVGRASGSPAPVILCSPQTAQGVLTAVSLHDSHCAMKKMRRDQSGRYSVCKGFRWPSPGARQRNITQVGCAI